MKILDFQKIRGESFVGAELRTRDPTRYQNEPGFSTAGEAKARNQVEVLNP
jgi:hypothetical protein